MIREGFKSHFFWYYSCLMKICFFLLYQGKQDFLALQGKMVQMEKKDKKVRALQSVSGLWVYEHWTCYTL